MGGHRGRHAVGTGSTSIRVVFQASERPNTCGFGSPGGEQPAKSRGHGPARGEAACENRGCSVRRRNAGTNAGRRRQPTYFETSSETPNGGSMRWPSRRRMTSLKWRFSNTPFTIRVIRCIVLPLLRLFPLPMPPLVTWPGRSRKAPLERRGQCAFSIEFGRYGGRLTSPRCADAYSCTHRGDLRL